MNNNMPNNFNNGMPNNGGNTPMGNSMPNPVENAAKEQLVGGQSTVGNGPSVMQGMPNVGSPAGAMQGVGSVQNNPNVMQGGPVPNVKPEPVSTLPGQNHSGVNAVTMQKEEVKKDAPEVVAIPNFASNIPERSVPQQPNVGPTPNVTNVNPAPTVNQNMNVPNPMGVNPGVNVPNQIGNPNNNSVNNNPMPKPAPSTTNVIGANIPSPATTFPNNSAANQLSSFEPENVSSNNMNSIGGPKPQSIGAVPPTANGFNSTNGLNNGVNEPNNLNGPMNENVDSGISQIGTSDMGSMDDEIEMPTRKFPLSVREMVLIGIALIGIVIVVIKYWP